jgi:mutator protein MutT
MSDIVNGVLVRRDTVLLARRSPARRTYPGRWSFPGGHVEAGENRVEALHRELDEELGVRPLEYSRIAEIADPVAPSIRYYLYVVTEWLGEPVIRDGEHSELLWSPFAVAATFQDLALEDYRAVFASLAERYR